MRRALSLLVIIAVVLAAMGQGGHLSGFLDLGAVFMVFGVTAAGTLASYSFDDVRRAYGSCISSGTELSREESLHGANVFSRMSIMASGAGLVGALVGMLGLLSSLDDPTKMGPYIAVSLLSVFYAVLVGELMFGSMASDCLSRGGLTGVVSRAKSYSTHRSLIGLGMALSSLGLVVAAIS
jgi:flagellar motor component MotA